jgi:hypothetical protein
MSDNERVRSGSLKSCAVIARGSRKITWRCVMTCGHVICHYTRRRSDEPHASLTCYLCEADDASPEPVQLSLWPMLACVWLAGLYVVGGVLWK